MKKVSLLITSTVLLIAGTLTRSAVGAAVFPQAAVYPLTAQQELANRTLKFDRLLATQESKKRALGYSREQIQGASLNARLRFIKTNEDLLQRARFEQEFHQSQKERIRKEKEALMAKRDLSYFRHQGQSTLENERKSTPLPESLPLLTAGSTTPSTPSQAATPYARAINSGFPALRQTTSSAPAIAAPTAPL